ncbi:hypothetical protein FF38_11916 [Lucilia cuprina]|uniref:SKA complex subunit 1 n=1 Tax=Lucilia cuprina TaxID=7375 RepID=A0A0L0BYG7_LUCCU|nr:Spindle and kinetochore-associated protein 1 [Lucilia cuprina]KNC25021.1 hypothetical protein FF38_11916 [Lucilia cuprina]
MEDIEEQIKLIEVKISKLNNFIALSLRREKVSKELEKLVSDAIIVRDLMTKSHELLQKEFNTLENDYNEVMSEMRKKQMLVMNYVIKEKKRKIKESEEEEKKVQLILSGAKSSGSAIKANSTAPKSAVKKIDLLAKLNPSQTLSATPKIKINDYKQSPMIKKKVNPIFQFEEFDVTITQQQFDKIPKYMCGRETLDQLNSFLETVIIPCFNEKYQLMHKERSCLRNLNDIELWKLYNEQSSYLPGRSFITPGDVTRKLNKMLDKKNQNRLIMLRHIGILHEVRVKQTVCYVWSYNDHN